MIAYELECVISISHITGDVHFNPLIKIVSAWFPLSKAALL